MPKRQGEKGIPVVEFEPRLEVSPFSLFRRLRGGDPPLLIDLRPPGGRRGLAGAEPRATPGWTPPAGRDVVLLDDDGSAAVEEARRLQAAGYPRVKALFGGLELYEFALDPEVIGQPTYLIVHTEPDDSEPRRQPEEERNES
ncbi:MAG TPA: hypothetical protein VHR45_22930 [Thermoanaerobaculia bacterium]|nr:hypothetical protein [Thermoanaerobaculia bacterium]